MMATKTSKPHYDARDHLTAYLVLLVVVSVIFIGATVLYFTGVFDPVEVGPALVDAKPLELPTQLPRIGLLDWLIPSASAEEAEPDAEDTQTAPPADTQPAAESGGAPDLASILAGLQEEEGEQEISEEDLIEVSKNDLSINPNLPDEIYNVLLLATDSRDINKSGGRTDVIIVASINKKTNEVKLVSLSRDMYIKIPGGSENKLNAAYAYGGPLLSIKTVNSVFELNIQDYAIVNFHTMAAIVDALGGVDIYLEPGEWEGLNYNVALAEDYEGFEKSTARIPLTADSEETVVHLDGLQAVAYARIRKMDDDLQRSSRQRVLLQAIMQKGLSNMTLSTFLSLATKVMNSIGTNVNLQTVIEIGTWALGAEGITLNELSIPVAGSYHSGVEKDMDVIIINLKENVSQVHTFLFGEYIPATAP